MAKFTSTLLVLYLRWSFQMVYSSTFHFIIPLNWYHIIWRAPPWYAIAVCVAMVSRLGLHSTPPRGALQVPLLLPFMPTAWIYEWTSPPRIIIDFPGVVRGSIRSLVVLEVMAHALPFPNASIFLFLPGLSLQWNYVIFLPAKTRKAEQGELHALRP